MTARTPPSLITLIAMTGLSVVSMNLFLPVLPKMAEAFGADYALMSLAVSGFLAATVVVMLATGPLADRFGRRPVAIGTVGIFVVAAALAARAETIEWFLFCRFCQATILGVWVVALSSIRDTAPPGEAAGLIGYVSAAMAIAPMMGPMVGGALEAAFGWRATLDALWIGGLIVFALVWFDFGETKTDDAGGGADLIADAKAMLASAAFWACALCQGFSSGFFYVFTTGAPFVSAVTFGISPAEIGLWMASTPFGFFIGSLITGRIAKRMTAPDLMIAGRAIACLGIAIGLALVISGAVSAPVIFGAALFAGMGNGLTMPGANTAAMEAAGRAAGSAAGVMGALSVGIGAVAAQVTGAVVGPEQGPLTVMALCMVCVGAGLLAGLCAKVLLARGTAPSSAL
ncbi:MAG: MFS transporter [Pseudomonadota bacterium]